MGGRNKEQEEQEEEQEADGKEVVWVDYEDVSEVADERSWQWLRAGNLGKSKEGCIFATQDQALRNTEQVFRPRLRRKT